MPKLLQLKDIVTHNTRVAARNGAASSRDNGQVTRQLDCHVAAHHTQISSHVGRCHVGHCHVGYCITASQASTEQVVMVTPNCNSVPVCTCCMIRQCNPEIDMSRGPGGTQVSHNSVGLEFRWSNRCWKYQLFSERL